MTLVRELFQGDDIYSRVYHITHKNILRKVSIAELFKLYLVSGIASISIEMWHLKFIKLEIIGAKCGQTIVVVKKSSVTVLLFVIR